MNDLPQSPPQPKDAAVPQIVAGTLTRPVFIAMMASLMALNALAIDIMLPAFPNIQADFPGAAGNEIQYLLLSYIIGFGGAQLVYGPISDRYGRRIPLFVGMAMYVVFSVAGALAPSFAFLLAARFLQGVGAAATRTIAMAVVRDTHSGRAMASTMSLVMMVFMVVPVFAPMTGQAIIIFGEWHLIFTFMAVTGIVVLAWCMRALPETLHEEYRRPLTVTSVLQGFRLIVTNRLSLFYTLATAFFFGSLFGFLNTAQPIYVDIYGLGHLFPIAFSSVAVLMAITSFANSRLVTRIGQRRLSHGALILYFIVTGVLAITSWSSDPPFWFFMTVLAFAMPLFGLIGANLNSIAMEPLGAVAGTASSVLGFMQTVGGGIVGGVIGQFYEGHVFTLSAGFVGASAIALVFVLIAEKGRLFGHGA
ncbi:MAG: multidrug effflux MFS transporter [Brucellaceae bacterium]|nr:multidrug effflux MFS transporter [Brucellaceae bacterium]